MSRNPSKWVVCAFFLAAQAFAGDTLFVQAVHVDLKDSPKIDGKNVGGLKRGDEVEALEKQGLWVKAKAGAAAGWVSRLFLSPNRPIGEAELQKDVSTDLAKANRRRASSFAVSASSRGLMTDERTRQGRALYKTDFKALEALEKEEVPAGKLAKFESTAKLGVQP